MYLCVSSVKERRREGKTEEDGRFALCVFERHFKTGFRLTVKIKSRFESKTQLPILLKDLYD